MTRAQAMEYRRRIEAAALLQQDADAVESSWMYPEFLPGMTLENGSRVRFGGALYRCIAPAGQAVTMNPGWDPESAPSLFAKLLPGQGGATPGPWVQPDSTNPYSKGERVTHNGALWESLIDINVYAPGVYGWKQV